MTPEELKELRAQCALSTRELARESGVPIGVLERFEAGTRRTISDYEAVLREVIAEFIESGAAKRLAEKKERAKKAQMENMRAELGKRRKEAEAAGQVKPRRKKRHVEPQRAPIGPRVGMPLDTPAAGPRRQTIEVPLPFPLDLLDGAARQRVEAALKAELAESARRFFAKRLTHSYQNHKWAQRSAA